MPQRILITGASGCVGQYISGWLLRHSDAQLVLLLRDPARLTAVSPADPRISLLVGDLREVDQFAAELAQVDRVVHTATAWGDPGRAHAVNLVAVKAMLALLDPRRLQQVIYFSTASVLDRQLELLPEAERYGTEYIRTKVACLRQLMQHPLRDRIVAVFPTLVFGGRLDGRDPHPASYLTAGLRQAIRWLWLARFLRLKGSFHFIHAADIAAICGHLATHPHQPGPQRWGHMQRLVMAQDSLSLDQAIAILCRYRHMVHPWGLQLTDRLLQLLIRLFRIQLTPWDRFSLGLRHFIHAPITRPECFGLDSRAPSLEKALETAGIPRRGRLPAGSRG
ncbi:MAG: NAD(P)-dependent oxidoreductase [Aphanocapsa feldmannii 288cV]|nr:MAG: NAD(P)-dependent oxidoreductase [Aphanocapsa feldmannii 288cV]